MVFMPLGGREKSLYIRIYNQLVSYRKRFNWVSGYKRVSPVDRGMKLPGVSTTANANSRWIGNNFILMTINAVATHLCKSSQKYNANGGYLDRRSQQFVNAI